MIKRPSYSLLASMKTSNFMIHFYAKDIHMSKVHLKCKCKKNFLKQNTTIRLYRSLNFSLSVWKFGITFYFICELCNALNIMPSSGPRYIEAVFIHTFNKHIHTYVLT